MTAQPAKAQGLTDGRQRLKPQPRTKASVTLTIHCCREVALSSRPSTSFFPAGHVLLPSPCSGAHSTAAQSQSNSLKQQKANWFWLESKLN